MRRVVVTSIGAISPIGSSAKENWSSLMAGKSGVRPITLFDAAPFNSRIAGEISDFKPEALLNTKDVKKMDRFIQFTMVAGGEAITNSGLDFTKIDLTRVGSIVGVGIGGLPEIQAQHKEFLEKGPRRISPFFIPMVIGNLAAGQLSLKYGLKGPNYCTTSACSSSAHAVGESFRLIQMGFQDVMISGGAEAVVCELAIGGFCAMRALSTSFNDNPTKASRPFDKNRDGFVLGEGAAVLVLEELEFAKARGANILAEMVGYATNSDAYHMTAPSPGGEGPARCMELTLADAKINADQVGYVNAHGTSTPLGDAEETRAVKKVFKDHAKKIAVSSTKSMTGHLLGAAGALEAIFSVQALQHQTCPPTINLDNPDAECDLNYVAHEPQAKKLDIVLSNSFGFGGTNASLLFKKF